MDRFLLFINSIYLGLGSFFSFFVAPTLFKVLQKEQAGSVVERVFPVYFGIGLAVSLITLLLSFRITKIVFFLALLNIFLHGLHLFYILPTARGFKGVDDVLFMKWHSISVAVNFLSLFTTLLLCLILIKR